MTCTPSRLSLRLLLNSLNQAQTSDSRTFRQGSPEHLAGTTTIKLRCLMASQFAVPQIEYQMGDFLLAGAFLGKFYQDCWDCWGRPDQQGWIDTFKWNNTGSTFKSGGLVPYAPCDRGIIGRLQLFDAFDESFVGVYAGPIISRETNQYFDIDAQKPQSGGFLQIAGVRNFVKSGQLGYHKENYVKSYDLDYFAFNEVNSLPRNLPPGIWNFGLPNYSGAQSAEMTKQGGPNLGAGLECTIRMVVAVVDGGARMETGRGFDPEKPCPFIGDRDGNSDPYGPISLGGINADVKLLSLGDRVYADPPQPDAESVPPVPESTGWDGGRTLWEPAIRETSHAVHFQVALCRKPTHETRLYAPLAPDDGDSYIVGYQSSPGLLHKDEPPDAPYHDWDAYFVLTPAFGDWAGHDGEIAVWSASDDDWQFYSDDFTPIAGATQDFTKVGMVATWNAGLSHWDFTEHVPERQGLYSD